MTIGLKGGITGRQTSSATQLSGEGAVIEVCEFDMLGDVAEDAGGLWKADIVFTMTGGNGNGPPSQVMNTTFTLVPAGGVGDPTKRFWLISTGATDLTPGAPKRTTSSGPDEVVSGEAIRIAVAST
jgi:hypothetical protein